ncbi:hypothetical protein BDW60DRAFT_199247, partial [Aspergillus nidulans var. acristatus]
MTGHTRPAKLQSNIEAKTEDHETPLVLAVANGHADILELLVQKGPSGSKAFLLDEEYDINP